MPRWSSSRSAPPPEKARPEPKKQPQRPERPAATPPVSQGKADETGSALSLQLAEAKATELRLKEDLAELLTAHRHQGRVLERNQKLLEQNEHELAQLRTRSSSLEREIAEQRALASQRAGRVHELEQLVEKHQTLQASYEAIDRERKDLDARVAELGRSRTNAMAERDRLAGDLANAHATIAARDAEVAGLKVEQDAVDRRIQDLRTEIDALKKENGSLQTELERAIESQARQHRLQLEFDALSARWEVARAQLAEAEQALKTSQATIKAAQRLSSSVEWRTALDGILDAASELVRFERGTLAP